MSRLFILFLMEVVVESPDLLTRLFRTFLFAAQLALEPIELVLLEGPVLWRALPHRHIHHSAIGVHRFWLVVDVHTLRLFLIYFL